MTKDEAQKEVLRRWRALPVMQRQTTAQAVEFAKTAGDGLEFETLADPKRLVEAWVVQDLENRDMALRMVDAKTARTASKIIPSPTGTPKTSRPS